jgi:hypothetical protein
MLLVDSSAGASNGPCAGRGRYFNMHVARVDCTQDQGAGYQCGFFGAARRQHQARIDLRHVQRQGHGQRAANRTKRTRSRASFTSTSVKPTSVKPGRPLAMRTSTVTFGMSSPRYWRLLAALNQGQTHDETP